MSKENNLTDFLTDVASAIKDKRGIGSVNAQNFSTEIRAIEPLLDTINITENGEHDVKDYKNVSVLVESESDLVLREFIEGTTDTIHIPYGTEQIGQNGLNRGITNPKYNEENLSKIYVPKTIKRIGKNAIRSAAKVYYEGSLENWLRIEKEMLFVSPSNNKAIIQLYTNNENAIYGKDISIPRTVTEILTYALSSLYLGASSNDAHNIFIPNTITLLGEGSFMYDYGVNNIEFEEGSNIETLPQNCFSWIKPCGENSTLFFPTTKIIGDNCCSYSDFRNFVLKEGVEEFKNYAFSNNSYLTNIKLPNSLKKIGGYCFQYCKTLAEITLPKNLENIGNAAFSNCSALKTIVIESETPFTIASNSFPKISGSRYYVPKGTLDTFKSATNWSSYASFLCEKYVVVFNVPSALLNTDTITYSIDGGKTYQQFTNSVLSLNDVATIKIKSTDSTQTILIGTTSGGNDVGTISNSELTFSFTTDTNVYLTIQ